MCIHIYVYVCVCVYMYCIYARAYIATGRENIIFEVNCIKKKIVNNSLIGTDVKLKLSNVNHSVYTE